MEFCFYSTYCTYTVGVTVGESEKETSSQPEGYYDETNQNVKIRIVIFGDCISMYFICKKKCVILESIHSSAQKGVLGAAPFAAKPSCASLANNVV